jgi:hypothetical protein
MATTEKYTVSGSEVIDKVKQLIHEGNIRTVRIIYKGRTVLEMPLSVAAPAAAAITLAAPLLAAIGAFAALATECTIEVERMDAKEKTQQPPEKEPGAKNTAG